MMKAETTPVQNMPVEMWFAEAREPGPIAGTIVDSFAIYAIQLAEPLELPGRTVRSVVALRKWPGLDAVVSQNSKVVVQLFLVPEILSSFAEFDWHNLAHDVETTGAIRLRGRGE